jgi:lipase maturation factor 1
VSITVKGEGRHGLVRALFLRLLCLVYAIAFASLWGQIEGLVGSAGILPVADFLQEVRAQSGQQPWWALPTLCWLWASDTALQLYCAGGLLCALLGIAGAAPALVLMLCWVFYLTLVVAGQAFLSFQWDLLLLEVGFLGVLWAPWTLRPRWVWVGEPSRLVLWLLRFLLFRLMLASGLVKWLSGDPTWRDLSALSYHFFTQPLPAWTSWYVQQLPAWMLMAATLVMFVIEIVVPFCVFLPRAWRASGAALLVLLQVMIGLTGNYGFFNLLSALLCLSFVDDAHLWRVWHGMTALGRRWVGAARKIGAVDSEGEDRTESIAFQERAGEWPRFFVWPVGGLLLFCAMLQLSRTVRLELPWPDALQTLHAWSRPFGLVNYYGLFAVMTTERLEIVVEGSDDGQVWRAYRFRYKAGDLERAPAFVQPHMPRLDWQMWFAALRPWRQSSFFAPFAERLLQGSPAVLSLLEHNPFPTAPPRFVRARLYAYRFAGWDERRQGLWWSRREMGPYCPSLSLK